MDTNLEDYRYSYNITEFRAVDGDTIKCVVDLGFGCSHKTSVRLKGVDSPERRTTNLKEKEAGDAVLSVVNNWLEPKTGNLMMNSVSWGKYAKNTMGEIFSVKDPHSTLSSYLLSHEIVKPYVGNTKPAWTDEELNVIIEKCNSLLAG